MPKPRTIRRLAITAVALTATGLVLTAVGNQAKAKPQDVSAARACEDVVRYSQGDRTQMVSVMRADGARLLAESRHRDLGGDLVAIADAVAADQSDFSTLTSRVVAECGQLPDKAKRAGGYKQ